MTVGPGLSSVLEFIPNGVFLGMQVRKHNIFALFLFILWILIGLIFVFKFIGHDKKKGSKEKLQ